MSAANPKRIDTDETLTVVLNSTGETVTLNRRKALGLLSLQRASLPKAKAAKKANLSTPTRKGQEGAEAGNKPPTGADSGGGA